jgi:HEAT repeat protein
MEALMSLLEDPQVKGHAVEALGQLKAREAAPLIGKVLTDPRPWIRREAAKALKRMGVAPAQ